MIQVTFISNDNKLVEAPDNSNLLRVSLREKGGIPFKCGGGLCGTCKCRIERGREHTDDVKAKERKHLSEAQLVAQRIALEVIGGHRRLAARHDIAGQKAQGPRQHRSPSGDAQGIPDSRPELGRKQDPLRQGQGRQIAADPIVQREIGGLKPARHLHQGREDQHRQRHHQNRGA